MHVLQRYRSKGNSSFSYRIIPVKSCSIRSGSNARYDEPLSASASAVFFPNILSGITRRIAEYLVGLDPVVPE